VAFQPRLLSHGRSASASADGKGTWLIKLKDGNNGEYGARSCLDTDVLVVTDRYTGLEESHTFAEVCEFFVNGRSASAGNWSTLESGHYFKGGVAAGGFMMDERFHDTIKGGEVCCTIFSETCVHIAHAPPRGGGPGDPDMARRFAQSSDFVAKDLGKLASALGLKDSLPPWWSARFVPFADGASKEQWALHALDCFDDVLPHCRAAACTAEDPTASYKDIPAECRAEAMRLTHSLTSKLMPVESF